ncbi:MAG: hypothetical protein IJJ48_01850 [Firmicutes bacterium]|nr:hypothetical protein [Bacillota bacterium]
MTEDYKEILVKEATALSKEYNVMAIMCYGSQNYGLDTSNSDFDTKAIVLPSFEDLVRENKVSKTVTFECGECDIKDVRLYIENLKHQNVNYVETLFTEHILINPRYRYVFELLLEKKDSVAFYDKERSLKAMCGMLAQAEIKLKKACEAGDVAAANKFYVNVFKFALMADKYIKGAGYKEVLDCSKIRPLRDKDLPFQQMLSHAEHLKTKTVDAVKEWVQTDSLIEDAETAHWLDAWVLEFLKAECRIEICPENQEASSETTREQPTERPRPKEVKEPKTVLDKIKGSAGKLKKVTRRKDVAASDERSELEKIMPNNREYRIEDTSPFEVE